MKTFNIPFGDTIMTNTHQTRIHSLLAIGMLAAILAQQTSTAQTTPPPDGTVDDPDSVLHGRTTAVADAILSQLPGITEYDQVTDLGQLSSVSRMGLTVNFLQAGDFNSLTNVRSLELSFQFKYDGTDSSFTNVMKVVNDELPELQSLKLIPVIDDLPDDKSLPSGIFNRLTNLQTLDLSGHTDEIIRLPLGIFNSLTNLQTLDLSSNSLRGDELPTRIFDNLVNLRTLDLSDNLQISSLPVRIFDKLVNLRTLDLSDNELTSLPVRIFDKLVNLRTLDLSGNNALTSLPVGIFDRIPDNDFASQYGYLIHYPSVSFENTYHSVTEDQGTLLISVSLSESISRRVTVGYSTQDYTATAGQDYVDTEGTLIFPADTTNLVQRIPVTILDDSLNEGRTREVFRLQLQSPENAVLSGSNLASVYIRDDDSPPPPPSSLIVKFRSDSRLFVREGDATTVDLQVQLSHAYQLPVTVDYATQDGSAEAGQDYVGTSGTLTFPAGTTVQTFSVSILDDNQHEELEYFRLDLSNPVNAHLDEANDTLRIYIEANLEPLPPLIVNFSQTAFLSILEGDEGRTDASLNVQLLNGVPDKDVTVDYDTQDDGTATAGEDYVTTEGTITFPAFTTNLTQTISIPILGDTDFEPNEYFNLLLSNPTNAVIQPSTARIEIVNDDQEPLPPPVNVNNGGGVTPIIVPHLSQNGGSVSSSLMFRPTSLSLSESGSTTYQVRSTSSQEREMVVNLATTHTGITVNPNRLVFNQNTWQTYQTVTVTAGATAADTNEQASIRHSIPGSEGFIANNNAGTVLVTLAHTVVEAEKETPEPPTDRQPVQQVQVPPTDYDADDDGLIEVSNLAQLNAIRWDLDGDGQPDQEAFADAYSQAFPSAIANMGIPNNAPAQGYELTSDLDFDTNHNGHAEEADAFWNKGHGWQSIGLFSHPFQAVLKGNEHKIVGLFQDQSDASRFAGKPSGLFGAIGNRGQVVGLGLEEVDIKGVNWVGAIAGLSQGSISHCSVSGQVVGSNSVGGLVGHNFGNIAHSFVNAEVSGVIGVSVFVGWNVGGSIESSSAQGRVNGATSAGDLVGLGTPAR